MLESKLFLSKLNILYAVFKGTFLSSNITERLSPFFTSWICLFLIKGKLLGRSFEIVISSTFCGFSAVKSIYINRDMVGAVVGSQPFGGVGLSGSGFKAGGPNYLLQFLNEKVISKNSVAFGGNAELLNLQEDLW